MNSTEPTELQLEIQTGTGDAFGTLAWTSEIVGAVDHVSFDVGNGVVALEGRDYMSRLIHAPSSRNFVNQTSSEIVSALGNAAGLAVQSDPTTTIVGQFYQLEHARSSFDAFTRFTTSLDIITYLTQLEGYDCWVKGLTLYFVQSGSSQGSTTIDVSSVTSGIAVRRRSVACGSIAELPLIRVRALP